MSRTTDWEQATLRVLAQGDRKHPEQTLNALNEMLRDVRIAANVEIVENIHQEILAEKSGDASVVFMPMILKGVQPVTFNGIAVEDALETLPATGLVTAAEDIALDAEPEEGEAGEQAELADRAADLKVAAEKADDAVEKAVKAARKASEQVRAIESSGAATEDPTAYEQARQAFNDAEETVRKRLDEARSAREEAESAGAELE